MYPWAKELLGEKAITWTNADFMSIEPFRTNFNENSNQTINISFMKIYSKMSA